MTKMVDWKIGVLPGNPSQLDALERALQILQIYDALEVFKSHEACLIRIDFPRMLRDNSTNSDLWSFDVPCFCRWMIAKISFDDNFLLVQHLLHTCIQRAIAILSNRVTCCPVCIIQSIWNSFFLFFKPEQKKVLVEVVTLLLITMWVNIDGAIYCFTVDGESLLSLVTFTWDLLQRYSLSSPSLECHWKVLWWWV